TQLIANEVVAALVNHFNAPEMNLSNANVEPDILGRAYEYLIKKFADDAGQKAGEFFTPPEVVDILIRCLEPKPGETIYDPTCGSGGMLVHSADFLKENNHSTSELQYFGQEMNWQTYAIAKINLLLHGLEGKIAGGKSTLTDPQFLTNGTLDRFSVVIANFPFSDSEWFLPESKRTEDEIKKAKKSVATDGYKDRYNRFSFGQPPTSNGDFAFIQHIIASANDSGRCGVVCPQGVLFRGQPEIEEETGEFDKNGEPKVRRRKADDEYLIRRGILESGMLDAVIALPLNIFYGAGVPACLLILNKNRASERAGKTQLVYAARHYRELSAQNQLRPQDVMRILVHYHAFGDPLKAASLAYFHRDRLHGIVGRDEALEIERIKAEYEEWEQKVKELRQKISFMERKLMLEVKKTEISKGDREIAKVEKSLERPLKKLEERDEKIAEAKKRAAEDCQAIHDVAEELITLYNGPADLAKHARVVEWEEITENECNLNIPRYVDTFEEE
ncbi:N-6 DNA methylase, partial [Armatimonas sp.]|uniref:HsdM family class I SAM-dependent methyltransferase n=1 Tax=Armatimonas sp. TaxID=1872638 RepID=UPI0037536C7A